MSNTTQSGTRQGFQLQYQSMEGQDNDSLFASASMDEDNKNHDEESAPEAATTTAATTSTTTTTTTTAPLNNNNSNEADAAAAMEVDEAAAVTAAGRGVDEPEGVVEPPPAAPEDEASSSSRLPTDEEDHNRAAGTVAMTIMTASPTTTMTTAQDPAMTSSTAADTAAPPATGTSTATEIPTSTGEVVIKEASGSLASEDGAAPPAAAAVAAAPESTSDGALAVVESTAVGGGGEEQDPSSGGVKRKLDDTTAAVVLDNATEEAEEPAKRAKMELDSSGAHPTEQVFLQEAAKAVGHQVVTVLDARTDGSGGAAAAEEAGKVESDGGEGVGGPTGLLKVADAADDDDDGIPPIPPSTEGTTIFGDSDVLSGRGGGTNVHPGNRNFRDLINMHRRAYLKARKNDKPAISRAIVRAVREANGKFLRKDEKTGLWFEIGDDAAREKTSQALRQRAPEMRKLLFDTEREEARLAAHEHLRQQRILMGMHPDMMGPNPNGPHPGMIPGMPHPGMFVMAPPGKNGMPMPPNLPPGAGPEAYQQMYHPAAVYGGGMNRYPPGGGGVPPMPPHPPPPPAPSAPALSQPPQPHQATVEPPTPQSLQHSDLPAIATPGGEGPAVTGEDGGAATAVSAAPPGLSVLPPTPVVAVDPGPRDPTEYHNMESL